MKTQIIILAAGHGKRMQSEIPKALTMFQGKPFIVRMLEAVKASGVCDNPIIVIGKNGDQVREALGDTYTYAVQEEQLGTGHAVMIAEREARDADTVVVLYADHPLVSGATIRNLVETHQRQQATLTMATAIVPDFLEWRAGLFLFGRFVRGKDGTIEKIVELKDATEEEKEIKEVNPAYMCFDAVWMWEHLKMLKNNNAQKEYYLTDLVGMAFAEKKPIASISIDPKEALGVNTKEQLELMQNLE
jgi:bifunctional UDP-N-acetylglucosamine pyrophosphorylase / glucosamine-1-phosphate N-acetyltransferase